MSTLILNQGITAQRNKVACKQQGNHMVMQQEGTSNKHQGLQPGQRAHAAMTSRCGNRAVDTQTYRYIGKRKNQLVERERKNLR